jgi:hypothetical protein
MRARTKSFLWALAIAGVCMIGAVWLRESRQFPWGVFVAAIWVPLWTVIGLEGGPHAAGGPWSAPLIFSLPVLMWWCLIECGRQLWRRLHPRSPRPSPPPAIAGHVRAAVCAAVTAAMSVAAMFAPPALAGLKWLVVPLAVPALPASFVTFAIGLGGGPEGLPSYTDPAMYVVTFLLCWGIIEGVRASWRGARHASRRDCRR